MPATATPLRYAVRPRVIAKHVGQLAVVLGVLVLASVIVALVYREYVEAAWYGGAAVALAVAGIVLARMKAPQDVQLNEALVVTCLIFLVATAAMIAPMMSEGLGAVDACFEAVSGVTTTGLTTLSTVEDKSRSFLFTRAWMQWYGGLGMVVFSLALFTSPGLPAKQLATTEYFQTDLVAGSRAFARRALVIYAIMTAISVGGLLAFRVHPFDAVAYSLAAVSTGGFSPYDASLNALPSRGAQGFILLMCVGGAVSFMYYIRVFEQGWRALGRSGEFVLLVVLGAVASILLMVCAAVARDVPWTHTVIDDVLTAFSAQTTTGFNTVAMKPLDEASKLVIILSMAIGGEVGSTAGGFKVMRLLIFFRLVQTLIIRTALPRHAVHKARFGGEVLDEGEISKALLVILAVGVLVLVSWFPFLLYGYPALDSLFDVVSAASTVGLSTGVTNPDLPAVLKGILSIDMLMGRLELFAWLVLVSPRTWIGRRLEAA